MPWDCNGHISRTKLQLNFKMVLIGGMLLAVSLWGSQAFGANSEKCPETSGSYDLVFQGRLGAGFPQAKGRRAKLDNGQFPKLGTLLPWDMYWQYSFYETKIWKGDLRPTGQFNSIEIVNSDKNSFEFRCCDDTYLVFANKLADGKYSVHRCSPTLPVDKAKDQITKLGKPIYIETKPYYYGPLEWGWGSWLRDRHVPRKHLDRFRNMEKSRRPCKSTPKPTVILSGKVSRLFYKKPPFNKTNSLLYIPHQVVPWSNIEHIYVKALSIYKGNSQVPEDRRKEPKIKILVADDLTFDFNLAGFKKYSKDHTYLIYGYVDQNNQIRVDRCSKTKFLDQATEDEFKELGAPIWKSSSK